MLNRYRGGLLPAYAQLGEGDLGAIRTHSGIVSVELFSADDHCFGARMFREYILPSEYLRRVFQFSADQLSRLGLAPTRNRCCGQFAPHDPPAP